MQTFQNEILFHSDYKDFFLDTKVVLPEQVMSKSIYMLHLDSSHIIWNEINDLGLNEGFTSSKASKVHTETSPALVLVHS